MPTAYCPHCSKSHAYTLSKPTECVKCGKSFVSAFKSATAPIQAQVSNPVDYTPVYASEEEEDAAIDMDVIKARARQMARSISASDFIFSVDTSSASQKLGSLVQTKNSEESV